MVEFERPISNKIYNIFFATRVLYTQADILLRRKAKRQKGKKAKRQKGEKPKRRKGEREKRRNGEKEKWRKGEKINGEKEKWRNGEKEKWRKGEKEKWKKEKLEIGNPGGVVSKRFLKYSIFKTGYYRATSEVRKKFLRRTLRG